MKHRQLAIRLRFYLALMQKKMQTIKPTGLSTGYRLDFLGQKFIN